MAGSSSTRKSLANTASITEAAATKLSGADLERAALLVKAGNPTGAGLDGARLAQLAGQ